jgi:hypothetical protein
VDAVVLDCQPALKSLGLYLMGLAERGDRLLVVFSLGVAFEEDANSAIFIFRLEDLNEKS